MDKAIQSALLNVNHRKRIIICINGKSTKRYEKSKYYRDTRLEWFCTLKPKASIVDSFNFAISKVKKKWIFVLSDDDIILPKFLCDIDLKNFNINDSIIAKSLVKNNSSTYLSRPPNLFKSTKKERIQNLLIGRFHNHVSLFIFRKEIFDKIGGFKSTGYPNGFYFDTIFHAHLMCNSNNIYESHLPVIQRNETMIQTSAKFYLNRYVRKYMLIIIESLWSDPNCKEACLSIFRTRAKQLDAMLTKRMHTELHKINKSVFCFNIFEKLSLYYKVLKFTFFCSDINLINKISIFYLNIKFLIINIIYAKRSL